METASLMRQYSQMMLGEAQDGLLDNYPAGPFPCNLVSHNATTMLQCNFVCLEEEGKYPIHV